ncbi:Probable squalene-hopene cyclase OS=Planctomyces maris DSM 8797 GN=PM8797T_19949 PE=4 SV=1: Prenyltrans_1: Prenyltrans_2 [Gemmataceae bacterium]|nr:Probable squalene-hopene cyclase OS=Planctomyces maris DSM 8797 GN=PM8797T_19949 PE=4 SV=1: Prenyltrans_1: Prenyltrans_2 [Gemmataceae bacterium]VTT96768.1 Probable squalene-hopene cyclase OS=Planctomyces maris DSM 8797 GN=PM8797T_19949 PE=4 SV=1: Prenyltrans_1: Prenyltrans_2 [Gemmataceae bacterium]
MLSPERLHSAYTTARDALLAERVPAGHWVGELSTSALSTATAVMALHLVNPFTHRELIDAGMKWLADHQNEDGGWGDTTKSLSNISTTMLVRAALKMIAMDRDYPAAVEKVEAYLNVRGGRRPEQRAEAIRRRYGKDRTFSVPILMTCALARMVPWKEVPRLPFEAAALPQSWYRFARMPVVSYALPALIAIGQCVHHHRGTLNPVTGPLRWLAKVRTLRVLRRIQPTSGGYLEATPLTSFVVMALSSIRRRRRASEQQVIDEGVRFLVNSVRPDGSWPIDTNLATWVTTLSVNALAAAGDLESLDTKEPILAWLLGQQYKERHPYTGADPGGWAWTDLPGGVPDCDDTPGAMLALKNLNHPESTSGVIWIVGLQNSNGGWPTFCRGWGTLPFDRSGSDLTAHSLRALNAWGWLIEQEGEFVRKSLRERGTIGGVPWPTDYIERPTREGVAYLTQHQRPDGSWLPLWFGNQHAKDDINPVYGTARVLAAYRDLGMKDSPECQRGVTYLLSVQNADGGWGGDKDCPSSVEETALAVEVLVDLASPSPLAGEGGRESSSDRVRGEAAPTPNAHPSPGGEAPPPSPARGEGKTTAVERGLLWLVEAVESGRFRDPSPIGFYFAKLWYFEKLYPLIFTVAALGRGRASGQWAVGSGQ